VASSKHRQTQRFLDTLETFLLQVQDLLMKEKYPSGLTQRQRVLALEEEENANGYSYYGDSDQEKPDQSKKVGKRLVLHANE
jgi:carnitine O-acetyltransferase